MLASFSVMSARIRLDSSWHKARVAARILLKGRTRPLNARDKRLACLFATDPAVSDRLIEQGLAFWQAPYRTGRNGERVARAIYVVV